MSAENKSIIETVKTLAYSAYSQDDTFFDDTLSKNVIAFNNYGFSLGNTPYIKHYKNWHQPFEFLEFNVVDTIPSGESVILHLKYNVKHIGTFRGIAATGNKIELRADVRVIMSNNKVARISSLGNVDAVLKQIAAKDSKEYHKAINTAVNSNYREDFFNEAIACWLLADIKLTLRQAECLSLWNSGKSDSEMADILNVSSKTINHYQEQLRHIFKCSKKRHIFEQVESMGMQTITNECFSFVINQHSSTH